MFEVNQACVKIQQRSILSIPELKIQTDQVTVILGHNGSGKSTFMKALARQQSLSSGSIHFQGQSLESYSSKHFAQQVAFLPQSLPPATGLTVEELVKLGRNPWRRLLSSWQPEDQTITDQALKDTQVDQYRYRFTDQLSGGERQRAWIAMLLAQQAPMLLLDEPTSALDIAHQYELMGLLKHLNQQQGKGVLIILHDINLACRYADRIIALKQGEVFFDASAEALLTPKTLSDLFEIPMDVISTDRHPDKVAIVS